MRISHGCICVLGIAFCVGGGLCVFFGLLIATELVYVGIAFGVVGGISLCCMNCSSLNMPLVLVYQGLN